MPFRSGSDLSGFVDMLGSRLGGFTEPRGSPRLSGECWIPGSIRDGGIVGALDPDGLSGMMPGAGLPPLSGNWPGGVHRRQRRMPEEGSGLQWLQVEEPSRATIWQRVSGEPYGIDVLTTTYSPRHL